MWANGWDGPTSWSSSAPFGNDAAGGGAPHGEKGQASSGTALAERAAASKQQTGGEAGGKAGAPPAPPPKGPPPPPQRPWLRLAVPNSNANVDLNGDCRADLVVIALPPDAPAEATCYTVACTMLVATGLRILITC